MTFIWFIILKSFYNREHEILLLNKELHNLNSFWGHQIKKDEMSKACGACEGEERCMQGFGW